MDIAINIAPHALEQLLASGIVIALLVTLAVVVKKFIGE